MDDQALAEYHAQRLGALRRDRGNFETQWEEAAERVIPAHRGTFTDIGGQRTQGEKKTELAFDATAGLALHKFASVIESLVTPSNVMWALLKSLDKTLQSKRVVRVYFDDLAQCLHDYRYRPSSNFIGNSQQVYLGLGAYGNGTLYIDKPEKERGIRYRSIHLGETFFAQNHGLNVDTMYRPFKMSARQILEKYGMQNVPEEVIDTAKNPQRVDVEDIEVLHVVYPREGYDPGRIDPGNMPFASVHLLPGKKKTLRVSGYRRFPFAVTRYAQMPGEVYGRGPAQFVLPGIKVLNEMKRTVLKQGHRIVDPVLLSHDDGNFGTFTMKAGATNPGTVTKDGKMLVHPMPVGNIAIGDKLMELERQVINDAFLITLFQILIDTPQMTATEVLERAREKGMLLAPTAGRMSSEFLGPLIDRELDVLSQQGLLPPPPPILLQAAVEYKVEYDNPISKMARSGPAAGFMRALGVAADYAKMTGDMSPLDWFDTDTAMPEILDINGSPTRWTRTEEEVMARRGDRKQSADQQKMIEAAPALAAVAKQVPAAAR